MIQRTAIFLLILCIAFPTVAQARKKALLIGISDYKHLPSRSDTGIADLRGPSNDLKAFNALLISQYGFKKEDILILKDRNATREAIKKNFETWLVKGTEQNDIVLIYFSGHGSRVPDQNGDEEDGWDEVLCPYDMVPKGGKNIILDDALGKWLHRLEGKNTCLIVDSCNSGGVSRGIGDQMIAVEATPAKGTRFIPITDYHPSVSIKGIAPSPDIPAKTVFFSAAKENEVALEIKMSDGFHGGFSYSLFKTMAETRQLNYKKLYAQTVKFMKDNLQLPQDPQLIAPDEKLTAGVLGVKQANDKSVQHMASLSDTDVPSSEARTVSLANNKQINDAIVAENPSGSSGDKLLNQKVLVALERTGTGSDSGLNTVCGKIRELTFVRIVTPNEYFDRLLKKCPNPLISCVQIANKIGDVTRMAISDSNHIIGDRVKSYFKFAYLEKLFTNLRPDVYPFELQLNVKNKNRRDFKLGEKIVFEIKADRNCYVILFNVDSLGRIHMLFPNRFQPSCRISRGKNVYIPSDARSNRTFPIEIQPPAGTEILKAIGTATPLELNGFEFEPGFNPNFISENTVDNFTEELVRKLSSGELEWTEKIIILRTYNPE